jgi:hypothetical protein
MRIHGKNGQVLMDPTGGATPVLVADLNSWTLDASKARVEATAFGDTNIIRLAGLPDYSGTVAGWYDKVSAGIFFDVVFGDVAPMLQLVPDSADVLTDYFQGLANLDGSVNCSATGAVAISGKWDAAANWTYAHP